MQPDREHKAFESMIEAEKHFGDITALKNKKKIYDFEWKNAMCGRAKIKLI